MASYIRFLWFVLALAASGVLAATQTRTSAFEYDPATGLLVKEIIEPDNPALCLVKVYTYDAFGNNATATTRNCNGSSSEAAAPSGDPLFQTRTSSSSFELGSAQMACDGLSTWSAGQFPTTSTNALGQSENKAYDARFGGVVGLTGPNGLTTYWCYDTFGRRTYEFRAD